MSWSRGEESQTFPVAQRQRNFIWEWTVIAVALMIVASGGSWRSSRIHPFSSAEEQRLPSSTNPNVNPSSGPQPLGMPVAVSGFVVTPTTAGFRPFLSEEETEGYLVADVALLNRNDKVKPYGYSDWKLWAPNGEVIEAKLTGMKGGLSFGGLPSGGTVAGKVAFEVGDGKGDYLLVYEGKGFPEGSRGQWRVTI